MATIPAAAHHAATASAPEHGAGSLAAWMRQFFPAYCILLAVITFGYTRYDVYQLDGDAIAYMDIGDLIRAHRWAGIVDGYWHPMYPALLALGHTLLHSTLATELRAYYVVNYAIFLFGMLAVVAFTDALVELRNTLNPGVVNLAGKFLCNKTMLRYLGLAMVAVGSQRELSLGKVRPDALLQAFILLAVAALLRYFATSRVAFAALIGLALGCAYLTKSFALVLTLICVLVLVGFGLLWLRQSISRLAGAALTALLCFTALAGPYIAALSRQHGRLDFGDSGSLNYAWYVGGTRKMHLEPYMTSEFGSAEVHLKHPERELMRSPQVLSYAEFSYGTYPDWFDTTYWNDQVKPHFALHGEISRSARNGVLVMRYIFNHPEALLLLALLATLGARPALRWKPADTAANPFWAVPGFLGIVIWGIYGLVNTEERYVTVAFLLIVLSLFATLRLPNYSQQTITDARPARPIAATLIFFLALLAAGESLRIVFQSRRDLSVAGVPGGWYSPHMVHAAQSLNEMGVKPGDQIACVGWDACLYDQYWARLAGVRILTEVYAPDVNAYAFLTALPNRDEVIATVRAQGPKVLVADFQNARVSNADPFFRHWQQLGDTSLYALPLNADR